MKAPIYLRKDPVGGGAWLHDAFDKHLGYVHAVETAEAIVAAVNAQAMIAESKAA